jgi:hypothetical protein
MITRCVRQLVEGRNIKPTRFVIKGGHGVYEAIKPEKCDRIDIPEIR